VAHGSAPVPPWYRQHSPWSVPTLALLIGIGAAAFYYAANLTLSHYDAKAHLVVARRILDSARPGWMQIGAVWLPLPHLLNVLPVQIDALYRTGLSAVALSVAGFCVGASALWRLVAAMTGSRIAAWSAFVVFVAHPDVLYLQATPMTESLLMGLCLLGIGMTWAWAVDGSCSPPWRAGLALAMACLTRYEAWPVTAAAVIAAAIGLLRTGTAPARALGHVAALACWPMAAVIGFMVLSRLTVGSWLVTGGFFDVDVSTYHRPLVVVESLWRSFRAVHGNVMTLIGFAAVIIVMYSAFRSRGATHSLLVLSLFACLALPAYALWNGHPSRIRYLVPSAMALAAITGVGVGLLPRYRSFAAAAVALTALIETPPLSGRSPMVVEAQRDSDNVAGRQRLTDCFLQTYDHTPILASMGSLAPYMQETSRAGLPLRQYIHEGLGTLWTDSLVAPGRHARWMLIEEQAEGGDVLARMATDSTTFLIGFVRHCEGGGVALYRRLLSYDIR
jgi:hypothetical protein